MKRHDCGHCAGWRELLGAFWEGRKDEAALEAARKVRAGEGVHRDRPDCRVAVRALAILAQEGFFSSENDGDMPQRG